MGKKRLYTAFIAAFLLLYLIVACISFVHSISFFSIGNAGWMSCLLGFSFELGQAVVLASILLSDNRKSLLTWALFVVLTAVQCIGNVYSVYSYMSRSAEEYYRYLQEPLLFWLQGVDQQTVKVIISWITGALLPIIALGMTGMVASNIRLVKDAGKDAGEITDKDKNDSHDDIIDNDIDRPAEHTDTPELSGFTEPAATYNRSDPEQKEQDEPAQTAAASESAETSDVIDTSEHIQKTADVKNEISTQDASVSEKEDDGVNIDMLEPVITDDGYSGGRTELRFMPRNLKRKK